MTPDVLLALLCETRAERDALIVGYEAVLDELDYLRPVFRRVAEDNAELVAANRRLAARLRERGAE